MEKGGTGYWLVYWYSYLYLLIKKWFKPRRIPPYDYLADGQPEKQGFSIPKEEQKLENPKPHVNDEEFDSAYCFGINSKSEYLSVRLSHLSGNVVGCSLFLRLSNGRCFCLPEEHANQVRTNETDTFGSSRFKMQCILPMRKWRIFFNGLLREIGNSDENGAPIYRHVKIAVLYNPSAGAFDFTDELPRKTFAELVANDSSLWNANPETFHENLQRSLDYYEQPGMFIGTVVVDDEGEIELNLWGSRGHFMGSLLNDKQYGSEVIPWKFYGQMTNGALIQIGETKINTGKEIRLCYGYVMRSNGFIYPLDYIKVLHRSSDEMRILCNAGTYEYSITVKVVNNVYGGFKSQSTGGYVLREVEIVTKDMKGKGLLYLGSEVQGRNPGFEHAPLSDIIPSKEMCTPIWNSANGFSGLSGGKGSSLYHLYNMTDGYTVPRGVIVTTNGYQKFIHKNLDRVLEELEKTAPFLSTQDLSEKCKRIVKLVSDADLPDDVCHSITRNLEKVFGKNVSNIKFAVRSSATGEDTEQMSAAGQMDTFLGVNGIKEILDAVKKCWASQFAFVAVQYKRQYGQQLNCPMAVVVQEMVPCEVAGVAFSCDPLTGNPSFLSITANYGLGESVVSASSEPDTVVLKRTIDGELSFHSRQIGMKKTKITMDEKTGVKESEISEVESKECCISDDMALTLGRILVSLEKQFGNPRDIEWGIKDGYIFLLQCRPVTSIDTETEYEIRHFGNGYMRTENEYYSTANVGEVLPGATTPISGDLQLFQWDYINRKATVSWEGAPLPKFPYFPKRFMFANNHVLVCVADSIIKFGDCEGDQLSDETKALCIAIFGRVVDDPELIQMCKDRHNTHYRPDRFLDPIRNFFKILYLLMYVVFGGYLIRRGTKTIDKIRTYVKKNSSSSEMFDIVAQNWFLTADMYNCHINVSVVSSIWNHVIVTLLVKENGGYGNAVFSDFAYLVSTLTEVESADVPSAIQELAHAVGKSIDIEEFRNMSSEDALQWLKTTRTEAGDKFQQFLEKHGHRCFKELDVYSKPWGTDPKPLVKIIQNNVSKDSKDSVKKTALSYEEIFSNMNIKLGFFSRLLLRLVLPLCRRGVRQRETTKSVLVKAVDKIRKLFDHLGDSLVAEGRLPNKDLLYFLQIPELQILIDTRSPRLVSRIFRRWKCHPELDRIIFPEMIRGMPKPRDLEEIIDTEDGFTMTGVPVSRGIAKATARVVVNIEDAKNIQPGDVLITYSTDIAWSPYFPLLSGVVTELGGLISHGAVVAREYGLPCVVNLHGAIRSFKSGDYVLLNGNEGFLKKLKSA